MKATCKILLWVLLLQIAAFSTILGMEEKCQGRCDSSSKFPGTIGLYIIGLGSIAQLVMGIWLIPLFPQLGWALAGQLIFVAGLLALSVATLVCLNKRA